MPQKQPAPPSWLFSNNHSATEATALVTPESNTMHRAKDQRRKQAPAPSQEDMAAQPPVQLLDLVEEFLSEHSFERACSAFKKQRQKKGWKASASGKGAGPKSLNDLFRSWETSPVGKDDSTDARMSGANSDSSSCDSSSSDSDSDGKDEAKMTGDTTTAARVAVETKKGLKRKALELDESSSSDSDSSSAPDSSSGSEEQPKKKKQRTARRAASTSSSSDSTSPDSNSSSADSSSDSSSKESESESESESKPIADVEAAAKVALPESSASSSDSDSDSSPPRSADSKDSPQRSKHRGEQREVKDSSDSSATLAKPSPVVKASSIAPALPPDPAATVSGNGKAKMKQNVPFSRIPKDIKVDPRFSSNAYVPMSYSQRAHEDLIVTKGKGFTKEKNKKKRGSYRGGTIDIGEFKGVYFDD